MARAEILTGISAKGGAQRVEPAPHLFKITPQNFLPAGSSTSFGPGVNPAKLMGHSQSGTRCIGNNSASYEGDKSYPLYLKVALYFLSSC